jgi:hypothetical protein
MKTLTKFKFFLKYFGWVQVPMIGWLRPKLINIDDDEIVVKIPLSRRSKNHLKSMYFGALSVGADLAGGMHGFYHADMSGEKISLVFKSFQAQFLKRPETDVFFVSQMGQEIKQMIEDSKKEQVRINKPIKVEAYTNYLQQPELVSEFILELSVKVLEK